MSVKITLEYDSVEEAIVALGKVVGLKGRAPKNAAGASATPGSGEHGGNAGSAVTESGSGVAAGPSTVAQAPGATPTGVSATTAPAAPRTRKPRADAGQPRGPNARTTGDVTGGASSASVVAPASAVTSPTPSAAPAQAITPTPESVAPAAADPVSDETVQKAVEKVFAAKGYDDTAALLSRFGVKRGKDLPQDQRQNFIDRVNGVVDRGEAI